MLQDIYIYILQQAASSRRPSPLALFKNCVRRERGVRERDDLTELQFLFGRVTHGSQYASLPSLCKCLGFKYFM